MTETPKLVFPQLVEGVFKPLRPQLTPALQAEIRELGIDLGRPLKPGYPKDVFRAAVFHARKALYPELSDEVAFDRMGTAMVDGFLETLIGKAVGVMIRLGGPERNMRGMQRNFDSGANFVAVTVIQNGPGDFALLTNDVVTHAALMGASIRRSQEVAGARDCVVSVMRQVGQTVTFDVKWKTKT
jgi:uncharacterized protein (TIGR02265 family)